MKADTPKPYSGLIEAYREIIPAILRQVKDPAYYVKRELPPSAKPFPTSHPDGAGRSINFDPSNPDKRK